jgi:hypothetical protein
MDHDGEPSRPRSELERSAVQSALLASLDFHTAVHGHAATVAVVDFLLPIPDPPTPPPRPAPRPCPEPRWAAPSEPRAATRGPAWADIVSDDEE